MPFETSARYPRRILLIALGTTPSLLFETLTVIACRHPLEMPTEIHVITTTEGRRRCLEKEPLTEDGYVLQDFCRDFDISPALVIPEANIHVIPGPEGEPLKDIRTPEENSSSADYIVSLIRRFCSDENSSLHVSIAGGRKSMGLLMGTAMTFYGRNQDRMSHVLACESFEASRRNYPSRLELAQAPETLSLAEIPFLKLRPVLPQALLLGNHSYSQIIQASQLELNPAAHVGLVRVKRDKYALFCEESLVDLEPKQCAFYAWIALRTKAGRRTIVSSKPEQNFLLRRQFVEVLSLFQTPGKQEKSFLAFMGIGSVRLGQIQGELGKRSFSSFKDWHFAFTGSLKDAERTKYGSSSRKFVPNLSNPRTHANDAISGTLQETIPDITNRRISIYEISGATSSSGTEYALGVSPENIDVPAQLMSLLDPDSSLGILDWHAV